MSRLSVFFLMVVAPALSICIALLGLETLNENLLGWLLLLLGVSLPAGGIIHYIINRKPFWKAAAGGSPVREEKGDLSFWLILPGFLIVFFAPPLEWLYLSDILPRSLWLQIAGLLLVLASVVLRVWTRLHIRGFYSGHVEVQADHKLVQSGPYRWVRHPGYLGYLLAAAGVVVGYASLAGMTGFLLLLLPGLCYRMAVEERLLAEQFGEQYQRYCRSTKRLIPGIW